MSGIEHGSEWRIQYLPINALRVLNSAFKLVVGAREEAALFKLDQASVIRQLVSDVQFAVMFEPERSNQQIVHACTVVKVVNEMMLSERGMRPDLLDRK